MSEPIAHYHERCEAGHSHETSKGAVGGAVGASVVPGVGTVAGAAVGAAVGHHEKKKHLREGTHK